MPTRFVFSLLLLSAASVSAGPSFFLLGVDYSEWLAPNIKQLSTDASGAIYALSAAGISGTDTPPSTVTKLSPDGKTIIWQNQLGIAVSTMAVDPTGGVYVTPINLGTPVMVAKLNGNGSGIAWTQSTGMTLQFGFLPALAADASGRAYVAGFGASLVRIAANGTSIEYTKPITGMPNSIAVDASGGAFVASSGGTGGGFLARFAPDGTPGFNATIPSGPSGFPVVALDGNGNPVVYVNGVLTRYTASGTVISSAPGAGVSTAYRGFALDPAGNAYILGSSTTYHPVKNSLAACGTEFLTVIAPDGSEQQTTYLPNAVATTLAQITLGKDLNVLIAALPSSVFAPSRLGPLPAGQISSTSFLLSLSSTATPEIFPLACIGNGGGYAIQPIAPGELLTLYGNGLGPQQGVQPQASATVPYPTQVANVQVTFDGTPAPILWAQDGQVNVVAPWGLNSDSGHNAQVCITYNSQKLKCLSWPVAPTSPGVFSIDNSTSAVAINADGSVNSFGNPAVAGSLVTVFATGLGAITPAQADGSLIGVPLPSHVVPVTVEGFLCTCSPNLGTTITITPAELIYSGPAANHVAGISQITFRVLPNPGVFYRLRLPNDQIQPFSIYVVQQP